MSFCFALLITLLVLTVGFGMLLLLWIKVGCEMC